MKKINKKVYFKSKESMIKTLLASWFITAMAFIVTVGNVVRYRNNKFVMGHRGFISYGDNAFVIALGLCIGEALLLGYTIYISIIAIILIRQGQFEKVNVIIECNKCKMHIKHPYRVGGECPNCGTEYILEEAKKFKNK
jgi:predicted RNA-binding Zn-ribbon protein involved in translation (DUF1610 family)